MALGGVRPHLVDGHGADVGGLGRAVVQHRVRYVGRDHEDVDLDGPGQQGGPQVLVDDGLDAAQVAVAVAHHRDAATAVGHDHEAAVDERLHGGRVDDLQRLRRGDHAPPALLAPVLPRLAVLDQQLCLLGREEPADGLGRLREARVVASTSARVTTVADRRSTPRRSSDASSASISTMPSVAWVCAPHQSSGTGGTTAAASSFLTSRLPTCGPLPCVITTSTSLASRSATASMAICAAAIWSSTRARPSAFVIAFPPNASSTLTRPNLVPTLGLSMGGGLRPRRRLRTGPGRRTRCRSTPGRQRSRTRSPRRPLRSRSRRRRRSWWWPGSSTRRRPCRPRRQDR